MIQKNIKLSMNNKLINKNKNCIANEEMNDERNERSLNEHK